MITFQLFDYILNTCLICLGSSFEPLKNFSEIYDSLEEFLAIPISTFKKLIHLNSLCISFMKMKNAAY